MSIFYKDENSKNILHQLFKLSGEKNSLHLEELSANSTDAAQEKHVPVVSIDGNKVEVSIGSVAHPMLEEHYITGIYIETKSGGQFRHLAPEEEPTATFLLSEGDEFLAAYEYCNLHGLWKKEA